MTDVFIDVLEDFKSGGQRYFKGERRLVGPEEAAAFCLAGWAYSKECKNGTRKPGGAKLEVKDGTIGIVEKPPTWRNWIGGK